MKATPATPTCPFMEAALRVSSQIHCSKKAADEIIERLAKGHVCIVRRGPGLETTAFCAEPHTPWRTALKELEIV